MPSFLLLPPTTITVAPSQSSPQDAAALTSTSTSVPPPAPNPGRIFRSKLPDIPILVIALRGTVTCLEDEDAPMVECGFWSLYTSGNDYTPSLREMIREEVSRLMVTYADDDEPISLTLTGHSLGGALATLAAYDIRANFTGDTSADGPMVTVVSFRGSRVGNRSFRSHLERGGTKILRIVNSDDPVIWRKGRRREAW